MGHSTKITLHGTHFESRTALRAHLRRIRNRWHGKGAISGRDNDFLLDLFSYHPEASSIAPSGVSHFEVHLAPERVDGIASRPCLWAMTTCGSAAPVSMAPAVKVAYLLVAPPTRHKRARKPQLALSDTETPRKDRYEP